MWSAGFYLTCYLACKAWPVRILWNMNKLNWIELKMKLDNTVHFTTLTCCLLAQFMPFPLPLKLLQLLLPCWLYQLQTWSTTSACVIGRRPTNVNIFCSPKISTSTKVCICQVVSSVNFCLIHIIWVLSIKSPSIWDINKFNLYSCFSGICLAGKELLYN
jgi:hypothetical protein